MESNTQQQQQQYNNSFTYPNNMYPQSFYHQNYFYNSSSYTTDNTNVTPTATTSPNYYSNYYQNMYYQNYQSAYNTSAYQQDAMPVRTNTPDKPIMNDSGLGISPEVALVTAPQSVAQSQSTSDDEDDCDESIDNIETGKHESRSSSLMKPPKPYLEIIADAILTASDHMMQLHEIYHYMSSKYAYFAKNVNKSWRNSVRHNLSLNECFVKAGRGNNGKGNYWKIHNACKGDFMRGNFRRKSFKNLIRQTKQRTQPTAQSHQHVDYNPINSLSFLNNQIKSFGIENFLNANQPPSF